MATLRIYALGRLSVLYDQVALHFPIIKTRDLLCFLLRHAGEMLERELIAEYLWPMHVPGKARRCLSTALWRLRQILECQQPPPKQPYLLVERSTLAFNTAASYWFDVEVFERQADFGLVASLPFTENHCRVLEEALGLYRGDFLEGCYDDWCLVERERLKLLFLRVLRQLQYHYRLCGAYESAISCGHRLVALDPLQEDVHRELMRCYAAAGERPLALAQFQRCRETLRREFHIEPMLETWQLYRRIQSDQREALSLMKSESGFASLQVALSQFRGALDTLESAWKALHAVVAEHVEASESAEGPMPHPERG